MVISKFQTIRITILITFHFFAVKENIPFLICSKSLTKVLRNFRDNFRLDSLLKKLSSLFSQTSNCSNQVISFVVSVKIKRQREIKINENQNGQNDQFMIFSRWFFAFTVFLQRFQRFERSLQKFISRRVLKILLCLIWTIFVF